MNTDIRKLNRELDEWSGAEARLARFNPTERARLSLFRFHAQDGLSGVIVEMKEPITAVGPVSWSNASLLISTVEQLDRTELRVTDKNARFTLVCSAVEIIVQPEDVDLVGG